MYYLLKWIKFSVEQNKTLKKILKNGEKNTGKVREFCESGKVGTVIVSMVMDCLTDRLGSEPILYINGFPRKSNVLFN